jgi:hypothetical protein
MLRGFDVSFPTDWATLQVRYGLSFGFVRCMREGEAEDAAFRPAWQQMGELAVNPDLIPLFTRGAYAFASPALGSDAVDDARLFWSYIDAAGPLHETDLFCLDLEKSALTQDETNDWAERWFDEFVRLNRAAGHAHTPGVYMGQGYLMNRTGARLNERFGWLWYPRPQAIYDTAWPPAFAPILPTGAASWAATAWERPPEFWQTAFHWPVPGYPDHDADLFAGGLGALTTLNQGGGTMRTPYGRTPYRGVTLNWRTAELLVVAEKRISTAPVELSQGSWSNASTSAGTHSGGGALDVRASKGGQAFTRTQLDEIQLELRRIGFAAWVRDPTQGNWPYHVHAIAIGDRDMSDAAAAQVVAYKNGRDGLAGNGPDYGPRPPWTQYPQELDELEMDATEHAALIEIRDLLRTVDTFPNDLTDTPDDRIGLQSLLRLDRKRLFDVATDVNKIDTNTSKALTQLAAVLAAPGVVSAGDVDEAALAAALAPLITTNVGRLSDEALAQIADAVTDEEARRLNVAPPV